VTQIVRCPPCKHEALSSNPRSCNRRKKKKRENLECWASMTNPFTSLSCLLRDKKSLHRGTCLILSPQSLMLKWEPFKSNETKFSCQLPLVKLWFGANECLWASFQMSLKWEW
jgi:hypothetical protein